MIRHERWKGISAAKTSAGGCVAGVSWFLDRTIDRATNRIFQRAQMWLAAAVITWRRIPEIGLCQTSASHRQPANEHLHEAHSRVQRQHHRHKRCGHSDGESRARIVHVRIQPMLKNIFSNVWLMFRKLWEGRSRLYRRQILQVAKSVVWEAKRVVWKLLTISTSFTCFCSAPHSKVS